MSNEKMREEFEAWSAEHDYLGGCLAGRNSKGEYFDVDMQHAWESWQASRAAIEVELPQEEPGYMYYAPEVVQAIESLGLKVKP